MRPRSPVQVELEKTSAGWVYATAHFTEMLSESSPLKDGLPRSALDVNVEVYELLVFSFTRVEPHDKVASEFVQGKTLWS